MAPEPASDTAARGPGRDGAGGGKSIEVRGVTKVFRSLTGAETTALADLSLDVPAGTISCIIGPSGCGKTTLMNLVAGFEAPTSGEILVDGRRVTGPGSDRVVIFQDVQGSLMPWLTARRNVEFGMRLAGVDAGERADRALHALELVGLGDAVDKYVSELSGGMQQRVQIARALVLSPGVLLMDEPFGALDYLTRSRLQSQLQELHGRTRVTLLFVTHDISEAAILGDDIYVMAPGGRLVERLEMPMPRPRSVTDPEVVKVINQLMELILSPEGAAA